ncbi:hypothetical protein DL95DRAFT_126290 [Leptodontidium sp. 2 PMI_412]|nr:hypothetical protein DL95DRAFT_126290 [Leptodontidium sp. 2 PMI_412]
MHALLLVESGYIRKKFCWAFWQIMSFAGFTFPGSGEIGCICLSIPGASAIVHTDCTFVPLRVLTHVCYSMRKSLVSLPCLILLYFLLTAVKLEVSNISSPAVSFPPRLPDRYLQKF